ncbi:MAG: hypothetical protein FJZ92_06530 [Chloroflexi bacterium]|nr:hypothetical protein [Chloroflexota bacterium]
MLPKYIAPRRRPDTVRRPRLNRRISEAIEYGPVVVCAPAGYGKSTLAVDWLDEVGRPFAWLSLDELDRDPRVLVGDIVGALSAVKRVGDERHPLTELRVAPAAGPLALAGQLVAAIDDSLTSESLFIIDDAHIVDDSPSAILLDHLINQHPARLRLIVMTRSWRTLPSAARTVGSRRAAALLEADLAFDGAEAHALLRSVGPCTEPAADATLARAGGWAAALVLLGGHASEEHGSEPSTPSDFVLADFIDREVLEALDHEDRELLEACSVLRTFDTEMVLSVAGLDVAARLHDLAAGTQLIAAAGEGWYRVHALLAEGVTRTARERDCERLAALQRTAAGVLELRGMEREAIELLISAGDLVRASDLVQRVAGEVTRRGEWHTLLRWTSGLPLSDWKIASLLADAQSRLMDGASAVETLRRFNASSLRPEERARLELIRSSSLRRMSRFPEARESLRLALTFASALEPMDESLIGEIELEQGTLLGMNGFLAEATAALRSASSRFDRLGLIEGALQARTTLAHVITSESPARALSEYRRVRHELLAYGNAFAANSARVNIGWCEVLLGDTVAAVATLREAHREAIELWNTHSQSTSLENLAFLAHIDAALDQADTLYAEALALAERSSEPNAVVNATIGMAMVCRETGDWARALALLTPRLESTTGADASLHTLALRIGVAAVYMTMGRPADAVEILESERVRVAIPARRERMLTHLVLAQAYFRLRKRKRALGHLSELQALVSQLRYDGHLVPEARMCRDVLEYAASRHPEGAYFRDLLDRARGGGKRAPRGVADAAAALVASALGAPRVVVEGREITTFEWRSDRAREMFFLLLHAGRPLRKEQIVLALWPEIAPERVNSAFHSNMYRMRQAIGRDRMVSTRTGYALAEGAAVDYDVRRFTERLRLAAGAGAEEERRGHLEAAVAGYGGPFLDGCESEWATPVREELAQQQQGALLSLAELALGRGDAGEALALAERVLALDPLHEPAVRVQMRAHDAAGNHALAASAYRRYAQALESELGERPPAALQALHRRMLAAAGG